MWKKCGEIGDSQYEFRVEGQDAKEAREMTLFRRYVENLWYSDWAPVIPRGVGRQRKLST
jgi:hypothetical protein